MSSYARRTKDLQGQGYLQSYKKELYEWGKLNPKQYRELMLLDNRQAYADREYERRTQGSISPDRMAEEPVIPTWEHLQGLELSAKLTQVAELLIDGLSQQDIADIMAVHRVTVAGWIEKLKDKLDPEWRDGEKKSGGGS